MKIHFKFALAAVAAAAISACGGGGDGDSGSVNPPVAVQSTIDGGAAKGILMNAEVKIYRITDAGPSKDPIATGKTGANGKFNIKVPVTEDYLLVEVSAIDGTTMLNENKVVNGEYEVVNAPKSLVLRSLIKGAPQGTVKNSVNPFTDAAIATASKNNKWSKAALNAYVSIARLLAGMVDPFSIHATSLKDRPEGDMDTAKLMVALAGFSSQSANCSNGTATGVECQLSKIQSLLDGISIDDAGTVSISSSKAQELAEFVVAQFNAANSLITSQGLPLPSVVLTVAELLKEIQKINERNTAVDDFVSFLDALRASFLQASSILSTTKTDLKTQYAWAMNKSALDMVSMVSSYAESCKLDANTEQVCSVDSGWNVNSHVATNTQYAGVEVTAVDGLTPNSKEITFQGTNSTTNTDVDITVGADGATLDQGWVLNPAGKVTLNGTYTFNDNSNHAVLSINNGLLTSTVSGSRALGYTGDLLLSADLALTTDRAGDEISGPLNAIIQTKHTGDGGKQVYALAGASADFRAAAQSTQMAFGLSGAWNPVAYSGGSYDSFNIGATFQLNDAMSANLAVARDGLDSLAASVTVDAVRFAVRGNANTSSDLCVAMDGKNFCANSINVTSTDSRYSAVVDAATRRGDVLFNGEKVGEITRSGVQVNGKEYSFY